MQQAPIFLVQTLLGLYITILLIRFLLQLTQADFYNPISQALVKITQPVVNPCLLYTSPSPRDQRGTRMPSSA